MIKEQFLESRISPAFTLAEVLVTLGIIGVVASLTMPGLMGNYQKKSKYYCNEKSLFSIKSGIYEHCKRAGNRCCINVPYK